MKKWQIENSETLEIQEILEMLFRGKTLKKTSDISEFSTWPFKNLPVAMKLSVSLINCPLTTANFVITSTN